MRLRAWLRPVVTGGLLLVALFGIAVSQSRLARDYKDLGKESGVYAIPQPEHLVVFSLGYRSALADLLFGRTMVDVGIHFVEKRVFEHLDAYLWAIIGLDPRIIELYQYADTMLTLSTVELPDENFRQARDILERGLKEFPDNAELWLSSGMFLSLVAPQRLPEKEDSDEWKEKGARMIEHGCTLLPEGAPLPAVCLTGARMFERVGQTEAAIKSTERLLAIADDEETRARAMAYLTQLMGERAARRSERIAKRMEMERLIDLPMVNRTMYQLIIPDTSVTDCVGLEFPGEPPECATSFARRVELETDE